MTGLSLIIVLIGETLQRHHTPYDIPQPNRFCSFRKYLLICLLAIFCIVPGTASLADSGAINSSKQQLSGNWSYHWGDLPKEASRWQFDQVIWKTINFPHNLPGRTGEKIAWLKIDLPAGEWRDPYLFISSIDLTTQVFHKGQQIYHFGDISEQGNSKFEGWPWHMIELPIDYHQHALYFRVFSDYTDIGISGEAVIGNRFDLLNDVYQRGLIGLSVILVVLLVGIISTIMGIIKKDRLVAMSTGLLSFDLALMMFAENELSQAVFFAPLFWRYIAAFSYFLIPAFLCVIIRAWLKEKPPAVTYWVFIITIAFVAGVAGLTLFTPFNFVNAYPYFDLMFIALVLSLLAGCLKPFQQQGITGVLMAIGILTLFVSLVLDMLSAHNLIPWLGRSGQWGLIFFSLASLLVYLVRDWKQQLMLTTLTHELETKVLERTIELESSKKQLEKLAREDFLTSLLNRRAFSDMALIEAANAIRYERPISLLLFDLDHFKDINDKYGHSSGDLVLKAVAETVKETCREGELICRYGGEEFVVLLHATDSQYTESLTKRLRHAINAIEINANGETITVTASFGLICLTNLKQYKGGAEQVVDILLAEADKVMYEVKVSGRDGIRMSEITNQVAV